MQLGDAQIGGVRKGQHSEHRGVDRRPLAVIEGTSADGRRGRDIDSRASILNGRRTNPTANFSRIGSVKRVVDRSVGRRHRQVKTVGYLATVLIEDR